MEQKIMGESAPRSYYILRDIDFISTSIERQSSFPCLCGGVWVNGGGIKLPPGGAKRNEGSADGGGGGGGGGGTAPPIIPGSKPAF